MNEQNYDHEVTYGQRSIASRSAFRRAARVFGLLAGVVFSFSAPANDLKVVLLAGQSNMDGRAVAGDLPPQLQAPSPDVQLFESGILSPLAPRDNQFGPEVTFGRDVASMLPNSNWALIKYARGGTGLDNDWDPSGVYPAGHPDAGQANEYAAFISAVSAGLQALTDAGHTPKVVGMLWTQGERDAFAGRTKAQYESDLSQLIGAVRNEYGDDLPFLMSGLSSNQTAINAAARARINDAQLAVAQIDPNAYVVSTDSFSVSPDPDGRLLHFDAAGQQALGSAFADSFTTAVPEPSFGVAMFAVIAAIGTGRRSRG